MSNKDDKHKATIEAKRLCVCVCVCVLVFKYLVCPFLIR